jgi:hypothetical protein
VEVVFELAADGATFGDSDNEYYTGSGDRGADLRFALPVGKYRGVMFLGTVEEMRLLAAGSATGLRNVSDLATLDPVTAGVFDVTDGLKIIEFTVSSISSNIAPVEADGVTFADGGSFELTGPEYPVDYVRSKPTGTTTLASGEKVPYFHIPSGVAKGYDTKDDPVETTKLTAIQGTFTYTGFPIEFAETSGVDLEDAGAEAAWLGSVITDKEKMVQTIGVAAHDSASNLSLAPVKVDGEVVSVKLVEKIIDLSITTGALELGFVLKTYDDVPELKDGLAKLQFFVEVQAFKNGQGAGKKGSVWRIVNGFNTGALDIGGASTGQNILLLVGDKQLGENSYITVQSKFPAP